MKGTSRHLSPPNFAWLIPKMGGSNRNQTTNQPNRKDHTVIQSVPRHRQIWINVAFREVKKTVKGSEVFESSQNWTPWNPNDFLRKVPFVCGHYVNTGI